MVAYTPETYVVQYGTSSDFLRNRSDELQGQMDFTAKNKMYSIQLNDLIPDTTYYYKVVSNNTHGSTSSIVQNFTTENGKPINLIRVHTYNVPECINIRKTCSSFSYQNK